MSSSPSVPPPHYTAPTSSQTALSLETPVDNFFDVVPQSDATSFQVGYLGLEGFQAWVKGDVLIKLDEKLQQSRHLYKQCTISLVAEESDHDETIPFFASTKVLWQRDTSSSASTSKAASSDSNQLPSTLPFSFPLTSDLPHCIHLSSSKLEYRLTAILESGEEDTAPSATRTTLVHLTRYSRPGALESSLEAPQTWHVDTPTSLTVRLDRTVFRRAEPITVHFNIPSPDKKLLSLSLRSVEANLYRIIEAKDGHNRHELLLAHSGKLCRFHSTRSIVLRLTLHPPFDASNMPYPHPDHDAALSGPVYGRGGGGGCESISQDTLMHRVSFLVKILICIRGQGSERRDVSLQRELQILPGAAGGLEATDTLMDSKRIKESFVDNHAGPSTWAAPPSFEEAEEEEYDGYEDVGRSLSETASDDEVTAASASHESEPPPSLLDSRHDLQVAVEVAGVGIGVPRNAQAADGDYLWRPPAEDLDARADEEGLLPPPLTTPPVEESVAASDSAEHQGPHRPPPYAAEHLRTPRMSGGAREDANPPAYPHPPHPLPFVSTPHPPSYEA